MGHFACLPLLVGLVASPGFATENFQTWYQANLRTIQPVPTEVSTVSRRYTYVFVSGVFGERFAGKYWEDPIRELRLLGVPAKQIYKVQPPSRLSFERNQQGMERWLQGIAAKTNEQLVLIGHSRGGRDLMGFALTHPDFIKKRVRAIYLIQPALGGSGLADALRGTGPALEDPRLSVKDRISLKVLRAGAGFVFRNAQDTIEELTHRGTEKFHAFVEQNRASFRDIHEKIFYIRSWITPGKGKPAISLAADRFMLLNYGWNDGALALGDQMLEGIGTPILLTQNGHRDFALPSALSGIGDRPRRSLIRAIFMDVGR